MKSYDASEEEFDENEEAVLPSLRYALKQATIQADSLIRAVDQSDRERAKAWMRRVVAAGLALQDLTKATDLSAEYWSLVGGFPPTSAEHEKAITDTVDVLVRMNADPAMIDQVAAIPHHDRTNEADRAIREGVLAQLARLRIESLESDAERLLAVYPLVLDVELAPDIQNYLSRVARLFILGFDVEVAALSRSALELALANAQSDERVRAVLNLPPGNVNLANRIRSAREAGLLSTRGEGCATVIRMRGNQSLHQGVQVLDAIGGPLGVVQRLTICLREIAMNRG